MLNADNNSLRFLLWKELPQFRNEARDNAASEPKWRIKARAMDSLPTSHGKEAAGARARNAVEECA